MPDNTNGRYHVLVHEPPAGLGGTGLAGAEDDRDAAIDRAREVLSDARFEAASEDGEVPVVAVDDQLTGETVFSSEDEPQEDESAREPERPG